MDFVGRAYRGLDYLSALDALGLAGGLVRQGRCDDGVAEEFGHLPCSSPLRADGALGVQEM